MCPLPPAPLPPASDLPSAAAPGDGPAPARLQRPGSHGVARAARRWRPRTVGERFATGVLASELSPALLRRHYPFVAELLAELGSGGSRPSAPRSSSAAGSRRR